MLNTESEIQSEIKTKLQTGTFLYLPQPNQLQHLQLKNGAQPKCKLNNNNVNWCTKSRTIFGSLRDSGTKALFKLELKAACAKLSQDEAAAGPEEQTKTPTATCNVQQAANKHTHTLMSLAFANSFSSFPGSSFVRSFLMLHLVLCSCSTAPLLLSPLSPLFPTPTPGQRGFPAGCSTRRFAARSVTASSAPRDLADAAHKFMWQSFDWPPSSPSLAVPLAASAGSSSCCRWIRHCCCCCCCIC